jgi:hypothetical protein
MTTGSIDIQVNSVALKAELSKMIADMDAKSQQAAMQILIEGKNAAHALSLKDTNFMDDGIERVSVVTKISPCIYSMTLGSDADYTTHQEFGPKEGGKRKWRFRPFIRPAVAIMQAKSQECIARVFG